MIVTARDGRLRLITQNDHAHLSGEILSLWTRDGMPEHPRRDELLVAAREHDNGWRETDSAPHVDKAMGRPHDFLTLPRAERWEIWRRGPRRFVDDEPYAALLITRHAAELHASYRDDPDWDDLFAAWHALEDELLESAAATPDDVAADYGFVELTDFFSLALCHGWQPFECRGYRGELQDADTLAVDPFPLAGATTFEVACRDVPERPYRGDADLAVELAEARWYRHPVRLVPA